MLKPRCPVKLMLVSQSRANTETRLLATNGHRLPLRLIPQRILFSGR